MSNMLLKEIKLTASPITFYFVLFGLMFFLPGYPVLCGVFFVTLGIFKTFEGMNATNDILFSALLPVSKRDIVKAKYIFVCLIEFLSIILMLFAVILRMTVLDNVNAYKKNALMNGNLFALGVAFIIFGLFNLIFLKGFFKTGYKFGKPFIYYIIACFLSITIAESIHYFPNMNSFNSFGFKDFALQITSLLFGITIYLIFTYYSYKLSCRNFEKIDL